ncbi:unnamed protein product [Moneuplotes crassus]|uniref:Uncharacterized protein n=1 Tax=Euplotes crassus TaxID=5936 RepID=A0AAD1X5K0_EUPCR|nr:unnamed protein product [Moneuplotes crassus]
MSRPLHCKTYKTSSHIIPHSHTQSPYPNLKSLKSMYETYITPPKHDLSKATDLCLENTVVEKRKKSRSNSLVKYLVGFKKGKIEALRVMTLEGCRLRRRTPTHYAREQDFNLNSNRNSKIINLERYKKKYETKINSKLEEFKKTKRDLNKASMKNYISKHGARTNRCNKSSKNSLISPISQTSSPLHPSSRKKQKSPYMSGKAGLKESPYYTSPVRKATSSESKLLTEPKKFSLKQASSKKHNTCQKSHKRDTTSRFTPKKPFDIPMIHLTHRRSSQKTLKSTQKTPDARPKSRDSSLLKCCTPSKTEANYSPEIILKVTILDAACKVMSRKNPLRSAKTRRKMRISKKFLSLRKLSKKRNEIKNRKSCERSTEEQSEERLSMKNSECCAQSLSKSDYTKNHTSLSIKLTNQNKKDDRRKNIGIKSIFVELC